MLIAAYLYLGGLAFLAGRQRDPVSMATDLALAVAFALLHA